MDTLDKYIEMCRKAEEIQKQWKYHSGDYGHRFRHVSILHTVGIEQFRYTWLPRQDQLIEMNIHASREKYNYANFDDFGIIKDMIEYADYTFKTFEKFLLNELMVTKYGKHWNGSEWDEI